MTTTAPMTARGRIESARHRVRMLLVLVAAVLMFSLVGAPYARACDCKVLSFEEAVEQADLIAEITIRAGEGTDQSTEPVVYRAAVERVWKGEETREIQFSTSAHVASCGLGAIPIGETLLVWASGSDGSYSSTWCALPSDAEDDVRAQLTREIGEPADLTDIPLEPIEEPMSPVVTVGLVLGGLAALGIGLTVLAAIVVVTVVLLRRPRGGPGAGHGHGQ
ncbi:hypothetical protein JOD52_003136 [Brachybacterium muris]|uniref:hypothetical protein n=1 Tax=Brachybacterium muris TaxID=219301 RepID=UPI001956A0C9|nr:hypothetical protein [Brachybacterium muris]MBM7502296.1 hypothetical protein [Brachybacterium muris]MCT2296102.1 hypothetical protein [Brachybacterium muris]